MRKLQDQTNFRTQKNLDKKKLLPKKILKGAGADLGQAQVKLKGIVEVLVKVRS